MNYLSKQTSCLRIHQHIEVYNFELTTLFRHRIPKFMFSVYPHFHSRKPSSGPRFVIRIFYSSKACPFPIIVGSTRPKSMKLTDASCISTKEMTMWKARQQFSTTIDQHPNIKWVHHRLVSHLLASKYHCKELTMSSIHGGTKNLFTGNVTCTYFLHPRKSQPYRVEGKK